MMLITPELGCDKEIFSRDATFLNALANRNLGAVADTKSTIKA